MLRPNTDDNRIWTEVYTQNEYRLPLRVDGWFVLDIGANIGAFSKLCIDRGAGRVVAFEPSVDNQEIFIQNAPGAELRKEAVWNVRGTAMLRKHPMHPTACYSLISNLLQPGVIVPTLTFVDVLSLGTWNLCKIDCEGAEYALFDCPSTIIRRAARYVIEFHLPELHTESVRHMLAFGYNENWRQERAAAITVMFTIRN